MTPRCALQSSLGFVAAVWFAAAAPVLAAGLEESPVTLKGSAITVPRSYGHLVSVVENNQIHYLYFEDAEGTIHVVLLGNKGTSLKASQTLEVISSNAYLLPRNDSSASSAKRSTTVSKPSY